MPSVHEQLTEEFRRWERRGRGWHVFDEPVEPEPPFRPFLGHTLQHIPAVDDGRKRTLLSSFVRKLSQRISTERVPPPSVGDRGEEDPEPNILWREPVVEIQASLPIDLRVTTESFARFLETLSFCRHPVSFELLGVPHQVSSQFAVSRDDASLVRRQLQAYFPKVAFLTAEGTLEHAWFGCEGTEAIAVEFGLEREFMFPIDCGTVDPFIGIIGALSELEAGELGLFQVTFEGLSRAWAESITNSVTGADGGPLFVNVPELAAAAREKVSSPLYAAVVRIAIQTMTWERTLQLASDLGGALRVFDNPEGNSLIPLTNCTYDCHNHLEDVLRRQSRRSGMVLNAEELVSLVHLPTSEVSSPVFLRDAGKTRPAPQVARHASGVLLGTNSHAAECVEVRLTPEQRVRHVHIIGTSGTGKSTLLLNLITQDIQHGDGVAVLDPHGDLVDHILTQIPESRTEDVVLIDPSDEDSSVGFNILSAHSDLEKNLLASDLVSVFQRLSSSWGDQMGSVLHNAILAFLESSRTGTLADLRRFLVEPAFRTEFLKSVSDPAVLYYWQKGFPHLSGNKSIGSVITRLETFLAPKPIRYMVSQTENRLDFAHIMDTGKIFLAKLSQGLLGKENSYLLGTLLISKFQQLAMARQSQEHASRRQFWCYIDEFHNFITPSMAEILSGARKYRIGLTLAHQELRQLQRDSEVASAVISNPYTRICFRVGDEDSRKLADGFASFEAGDLQNLGVGEAIARVERSSFDFNLTIPLPEEPDPGEARKRRNDVIAASRTKYGTPREQIAASLLRAWEDSQGAHDHSTIRTKPEKPVLKDPPVPALLSNSPTHEEPKASVAPFSSSAFVTPPPTLAQTPIPVPATTAHPPFAPEPVERKEKPETVPQELGRGGAQHKAVQQRIKAEAEKLGFKSTIEKHILDGHGSIDLLLERGDQIIACEISFSTTVDHEIGNVRKCIKAGYKMVAVVCLDEDRLTKIRNAVIGALGTEVAAPVSFFTPEDCIRHLHELPGPALGSAALTTRRGYKIKRSASKLTEEERKDREEAAIRTITEAMRKKA